jgi:hypothetical protein
MNAWDLMRLFSRYGLIETNGSSLAFWAAILSGAQFKSSNRDHMALWRSFSPRAHATVTRGA